MKNLTKYIFCILGIISLVSCKNERKTAEQLSLDAIPVGSMLICEIQQPSQAQLELIGSEYLRAFSSTEAAQSLDRGYGMMLRLGASDNTQMTIAAAPVGAKDLSWLYISQAEAKNISFGQDTTLVSSKYESDNIFTVKSAGGEFFYYTKNGVLVGSTDRLYLEQSLLGLSSNISLHSVDGFAKVYSMIKSRKNINILVNNRVLDRFISKSLSFPDLGITGQMAPWYVCDVNLQDSSRVIANGILSHSDSLVSFADVLSAQKAQVMTMDVYFPASTSVYAYYGVVDWGKFFSDYARQLKDASLFHTYNVKLQQYAKILGGNPAKFFDKWAGHGLSVVYNSGAQEPSASVAVMIGVKDAKAATEALAVVADSTVGVVESYRDYQIMGLKDKDVFKDLIGKGFGEKGVNYYAVLGDVAVFTYDIAVLKTVINDIADQATLATLEDYKKAKAALATKSNMLTMVRGDLWAKDVVEWSKTKRRSGVLNLSEPENFVAKNPKVLDEHRFNFVQLSSSNAIPMLSLNLQMGSKDVPVQLKKRWSLDMSARAATKPIAFPNHKSGKFDVLIQDQNNVLYLISDQGKLHWKKDLGAQISSDIAVVDLFDNKKYQMAFYTGQKYHVIDRLGNPVTDKARIEKAKKYKKPEKIAFSSSTNSITIIKNGKKESIKTSQSPVGEVVFLPKNDVILYSVVGKVWGVDSKGEAIKGMPISGVDVFTGEDFTKNGRFGVLCASEQGILSMWGR